MLILDTDHFSELLRGGSTGRALNLRLTESTEDVGTTVVTLEEQSRGWLARIKRCTSREQEIGCYSEFYRLFAIGAKWAVLQWDAAAAARFDLISGRRIRIGTSDLRIAAIVMANGARLLSRNLKDFQRIEELDVENWLD